MRHSVRAPTGRQTERVVGHASRIERVTDPVSGLLYRCECECGWGAEAEKPGVMKRLRHQHLSRMVQQGAPMLPFE